MLFDLAAGRGTPEELSEFAAWNARQERYLAENPERQARLNEFQDDMRDLGECRRQAEDLINALDSIPTWEAEQYLIEHPPSPKAILGLLQILPAQERKERASVAATHKHGRKKSQEKEVKDWVIGQWQVRRKLEPELRKSEFAEEIIKVTREEFDDFKGKLSVRKIAYGWLKNW